MWLGLHTVSSSERCPLFRVPFIERFHCIDMDAEVVIWPAAEPSVVMYRASVDCSIVHAFNAAMVVLV